MIFAVTFSGLPVVAPVPQARALTYVNLLGPRYVYHVWYLCPTSKHWIHHSVFPGALPAFQTMEVLGRKGLTPRYTVDWSTACGRATLCVRLGDNKRVPAVLALTAVEENDYFCNKRLVICLAIGV